MHNDFLNSLLSDSSEKGMELHYSFFQDTSNSDLKRILGKGFLKRGESGLECVTIIKSLFQNSSWQIPEGVFFSKVVIDRRVSV